MQEVASLKNFYFDVLLLLTAYKVSSKKFFS